MPRPFFVRLSSSRAGLHLAVPLCDEWDFRRIVCDDRMRVDLDTKRMIKKLPVHNLLWDVKNGNIAGSWQVIRNSWEIEKYLDSLATKALLPRRAYYGATRRQKRASGVIA